MNILLSGGLAMTSWILLKATVLLSAVALVQTLWRGASAASRHGLWMLAAVGLLILPALSLVLPTLETPVHVTSPVTPLSTQAPTGRDDAADVRAGSIDETEPAKLGAPKTPSSVSNVSAAGTLSWPALLGAFYGVGVLLFA